METKDEVVKQLNDTVSSIKKILINGDFFNDMDKSLAGNKSAGLRARLQSVELAKLFKLYRKLSVQLNVKPE